MGLFDSLGRPLSVSAEDAAPVLCCWVVRCITCGRSLHAAPVFSLSRAEVDALGAGPRHGSQAPIPPSWRCGCIGGIPAAVSFGLLGGLDRMPVRLCTVHAIAIGNASLLTIIPLAPGGDGCEAPGCGVRLPSLPSLPPLPSVPEGFPAGPTDEITATLAKRATCPLCNIRQRYERQDGCLAAECLACAAAFCVSDGVPE